MAAASFSLPMFVFGTSVGFSGLMERFQQLKYHTMIDVRSTRGKNARGHKVTGLAVHGDKLLVTSNDSRVRMYDLRDMALTCKYKGASNERSQIRASFSPDGRHIICGSEDRYVYLWRTAIDAKESLAATLSVRKDRNAMWERVRGERESYFHKRPSTFSFRAQRSSHRRHLCSETAASVYTDREHEALVGDRPIRDHVHGRQQVGHGAQGEDYRR